MHLLFGFPHDVVPLRRQPTGLAPTPHDGAPDRLLSPKVSMKRVSFADISKVHVYNPNLEPNPQVEERLGGLSCTPLGQNGATPRALSAPDDDAAKAVDRKISRAETMYWLQAHFLQSLYF